MQGRWNMWWQWGRLLTVSPSWKSWKHTNNQKMPISIKIKLQNTLFMSWVSNDNNNNEKCKKNQPGDKLNKKLSPLMPQYCQQWFWFLGSSKPNLRITLWNHQYQRCFEPHQSLFQQHPSDIKKCQKNTMKHWTLQPKFYFINKILLNKTKVPDFEQHSTLQDRSSHAQVFHSTS